MEVNWRALDNFPLLMYILAAKTLLLCLGFAGVKLYQSRKADAELKKREELKRRAREALLAQQEEDEGEEEEEGNKKED
ncbi:small integral membrane protein 11 [Amia ocellicauda]|uniref:small integral membrane protein 11 n=1 Tax=Amia ocellicauda TaxID=2972642 RepID=UPI003464E671|nr:SI11A protein [Amia calva]